MLSLSRITIFPIKAFDGVSVSEAKVLPTGPLVGDRQFALVDATGNYVNGKRYPAIHRIRAQYSADLSQVTLCSDDDVAEFPLPGENQDLAKWCREKLGIVCRLRENAVVGHPDDRDSPGPTVISTATLEEVGRWYGGLPLEELRRRFRMNLEVSSEEPFWEDCLVRNAPPWQTFTVGTTIWQGRGVCQRCAVPTRDSLTGEAQARFVQTFVSQRMASLPNWSPREKFDHFYRLGVNTAPKNCDNGATIRVGDPVELITEFP